MLASRGTSLLCASPGSSLSKQGPPHLKEGPFPIQRLLYGIVHHGIHCEAMKMGTSQGYIIFFTNCVEYIIEWYYLQSKEEVFYKNGATQRVP